MRTIHYIFLLFSFLVVIAFMLKLLSYNSENFEKTTCIRSAMLLRTTIDSLVEEGSCADVSLAIPEKCYVSVAGDILWYGCNGWIKSANLSINIGTSYTANTTQRLRVCNLGNFTFTTL